jgi:hypothetical protein
MAPGSAVRRYLAAVDDAVSARAHIGPRGDALLASAAAAVADLGPLTWMPVGSAACGTGVAPYSDVDVLARFSGRFAAPDPPLHEDPHVAYELFVSRLEASCTADGFAPPRRDFPTARFQSMTDEPSIELVPGCDGDFLWDDRSTAPTSALATLVFPGPERRWLGTDPALHTTVLDQIPGGIDYTSRELIRLLKLAKYRRSVPLRSYFVELFAMRWIEGSFDLEASTIEEIVEAMRGNQRQPYAHLGELSRDVGLAMAALAEQVEATARAGGRLETVDLATPERVGQTIAFEDPDGERRWASELAAVAAGLLEARQHEEAGDDAAALATWEASLGYPPPAASG